MNCDWCSTNDHTMPECPKIKALPVVATYGVIDPMHDEPDVAVVDRLHRLRAYCRGLLTDMRRAGVSPSPETLLLTPPLDSFEP